MGKKKKDSSDSDTSKDKKKKKKEKKKDVKKKEKKKEKKKDKKKKDKDKKKKESSSSGSGSNSSAGKEDGQAEAKKRKVEGEVIMAPPPKLDLPPPEAGIQRFEFSMEEEGPLGVRFSGGFPPLILSVTADSFAAKKNVPTNFEVHAVNGLAMLQQNVAHVMGGLKRRPVTLDVRPQGWKPADKVKEIERKKAMEEAEKQARVQAEEQRRDKVEKEQKEQAEREEKERAERLEREKAEREEQLIKARAARAAQKEKEEAFEKELAKDPQEQRVAAQDLMDAEYGSAVKENKRLPLRLLTRRKEVAWYWAGEVMELIGGGVADDSWTN